MRRWRSAGWRAGEMRFGRRHRLGWRPPATAEPESSIECVCPSAPHQIFPAPGVYDELMTALLITVSACTTPLNLDMPALTVTMLAEISMREALTVTLAE